MKKDPKKAVKKLVLHRETISKLQTERLDEIAGNGTYTCSFPCCPLTRTPACNR